MDLVVHWFQMCGWDCSQEDKERRLIYCVRLLKFMLFVEYQSSILVDGFFREQVLRPCVFLNYYNTNVIKSCFGVVSDMIISHGSTMFCWKEVQ